MSQPPEQTAKPAMTGQQRLIDSGSKSPLTAYREIVVADQGIAYWLGYELYGLLFSNLPGVLGYGTRRLFLSPLMKRAGKGLTMGRGVTVRQPHRIECGRGVFVDDYSALDVRNAPDEAAEVGIQLGNNVFVGRYTTLLAKGGLVRLEAGCNISSSCRIATQSKVHIGESTLVAAYVYIGPGNHQMTGDDTPLIEREMDIRGGVQIGEHCWIGAHSTILDGVTIGDRAIVGAHSLVKDDVPAGSVVAGCPAKIIRQSI